MVFNAPVFLFIFLPLFFLCYFLGKSIRYKNSILLIFSLLFYLFGEGRLFFVMLGSIIINYYSGLLVANAPTQQLRKRWVTVSVILNLLSLGFFKYLGFFGSILNDLGWEGTVMEVVLPIGISFYTFQSMSYVIDVYRDPKNVQKNIFDLGLYISMFPQLIAGPIVRYSEIQKQILKRNFTIERFYEGANRFIIGMVKKTLFANEIAKIADGIMDTDPTGLTSGAAWLGIIAYTLQIYFDFSGYSDMAIGLGKIIGFDFSENFNFPYISKSIQEFWRRWHISLSTWFRDYLYIPLGGNRVTTGRLYFNLFLVFFVTGFWHGASWNFIIWGLFHGLFIILERIFLGKLLQKVPGIIGLLYTLIIVMIGWVFFRIEGLQNAWDYLLVCFNIKGPEGVAYTFDFFMDSYYVLVFGIAIIFASSLLKPFYDRWKTRKNPVTQSLFMFFHITLLFYCYLIISSDSYNPFIYFRF